VTRRFVAVAVAAMVVAVVVWYMAAFRPASHRLASEQAKLTQLKRSVPGLEAQLADLKRRSKLLPERRALLARFNRAIPTKVDLAALIDQMDHLAKGSHVRLASLAPQAPSTVSGIPVTVVQAQASLQGSYRDVKAFVGGLYKLPRLIVVTSVQLSSSSGAGTTGGGAGTGTSPSRAQATQVQASLQFEAFTTQAVVQPGSSAAGSAAPAGGTTQGSAAS
jgi:Tfp pilus assembly protein PilO